MNKNSKLMGILALVLCSGLSVAGCKKDAVPGTEAPTAPTAPAAPATPEAPTDEKKEEAEGDEE